MATLNVKDALSYLDQVKVQFAEHPDVYNRFLDIMKDFKSQSIDTPGVIERVSTLFRGHPSLIQGFNTFLPPGYRIECSLDPSESNLITVTTPIGTTTQTPGGVGIAGAINRMAGNAPIPSGPSGAPPSSAAPPPNGTRGPMMHGSGARLSDQPPPPQHPPHHPHHEQPGPASMGYMGGPSGHTIPHGAPPGSTYPGPGGQPIGGPGGGQQHLHAPPHVHGPGSMGPMPHSAPPHHPHGRPQSPMAMGPSGAAPPASAAPTPGGVIPHGPMHGVPGPHGAPPPIHDSKRPPVEFNHAINYVNKIKQRFSGDPDTYKQFLEILQTYQKEQRPIHDVYAQVTILFENAKDLLDEFKQFLPDTSNGAAPTAGLFNMLQVGLGGPSIGGVGPIGPQPGLRPIPVVESPDAIVAGRKPATPTAAPGPVGPTPPTTASRKKRNAGTGDSAKTGPGKTKKSKHHHKSEQRTPPLRSEPLPASPTFAHPPPPVHHAYGPDGLVVAEAAGLVPPGTTLNGLALGHTQAPLATLDEVAFFDRVKKHIDDRSAYLDFLKLLNLYTQDIINVKTLVDRAVLFIGNQRELFATFKALCGYEMGKHGWLDNEDPIVENVPAPLREKLDLSTCKVYGASYRKLPKVEVNIACSGRDPMCWEVLNDSWVSHPTWASEGESFNPHKKNPYEDALYRSEEERHEYDYHIEANLRTIALLEPIAARISTMDPEERASFRLKPGLGGQSKSIYQRVIKKVYGREQGLEIINALHDTPSVAVPVVLGRLKQKDEEWKRAQREWNKVWREVDARNYYKSLDHQGVNFKASDKKAITAKAFVAEIEARKLQQQQRRLTMDPSLPRPRPRHQLVFVMDDVPVLSDALKLAFSFLDRATGSYSANDRDRIEAFLRSFVPKLLELDGAEFEDLLNADVEVEDDEAKSQIDEDSRSEGTAPDDDLDVSSTASGSGGSTRKGKKQQADLRRKILKNQAETSKQNGETAEEAPDASTAAAPANARATSPTTISTELESTTTQGAVHQPQHSASDSNDVEMTDVCNATSSGVLETAVELVSSAANQDPSLSETNSKPITEGMEEGAVVENDMLDAEEPAIASDLWIKTDMTTGFDSKNGQTMAIGERHLDNEDRQHSHRQVNFFCNSTYFVFVRLLQLLYSRLYKMKSLGQQMAAKQPLRSRINPIAIELGLQDGSSGPAAVVGATANASSLGPVASTNEEAGLTLHPSRYYDTLLDLCEKLFDSDIDQATFEESIRYMYGIEGYTVFTLDKAIGALIKTAQALTTDSKCQELQSILEHDRANPQSDASGYRQQIANRMVAESLIGKDENMFRIEWVASTSTLLIQLLSKDDLTFDDAQNAEEKWLHYISSFSLWTPTEGLSAEAQAPFLKRTLPENATLENDALGTKYVTRSALEIRVCIRTYKLFFLHDTEDVYLRIRPQEETDRKAKVVKKRRAQRWDSWLEARRKAIDFPGSANEEDVIEQQPQQLEEQQEEDPQPTDSSAQESTQTFGDIAFTTVVSVEEAGNNEPQQEETSVPVSITTTNPVEQEK